MFIVCSDDSAAEGASCWSKGIRFYCKKGQENYKLYDFVCFNHFVVLFSDCCLLLQLFLFWFKEGRVVLINIYMGVMWYCL